jgi:hypothetical protein
VDDEQPRPVARPVDPLPRLVAPGYRNAGYPMLCLIRQPGEDRNPPDALELVVVLVARQLVLVGVVGLVDGLQ